MDEIKKAIQIGDFEPINAHGNPYEIRRLSNEFFLTSNLNSIQLFDSRTFTPLRWRKVNAKGCAVYNDKNIYISDSYKNCISLINFDGNKEFSKEIKSFGSQGSDDEQLNNPSTIFCENEYLYVSDNKNKRIQILTLDLIYDDTIQLNFEPQSIAVSSTTIGIVGQTLIGHKGKYDLYFYDIKTKSLKNEYKNLRGRISLIGSYFYVVTSKPSTKVFIFDKEGDLIDEASIAESIKPYINCLNDGFMFSTTSYLFVASYTGEKFLKFKL